MASSRATFPRKTTSTDYTWPRVGPTYVLHYLKKKKSRVEANMTHLMLTAQIIKLMASSDFLCAAIVAKDLIKVGCLGETDLYSAWLI